MYEEKNGQTNALPVLWKNLEYIQVRSDSTRWVHVSDMPETVSVVRNVHKRIEQQESLFYVMDKVGSVVGAIACIGMFYLMIRIGMGWAW